MQKRKKFEKSDKKCDSMRWQYYTSCVLKFLASHIGLTSMVVAYCILGGIVFEKSEFDFETTVKQKITDHRLRLPAEIYKMTESRKVLNVTIWKNDVRKILRNYELDIVTSIKQKGWNGAEDMEDRSWTFAGALFYSITVITTIGKSL